MTNLPTPTETGYYWIKFKSKPWEIAYYHRRSERFKFMYKKSQFGTAGMSRIIYKRLRWLPFVNEIKNQIKQINQ